MLFGRLCAAEIGSEEHILRFFFKRGDYMALFHAQCPKAMPIEVNGSLSLIPKTSCFRTIFKCNEVLIQVQNHYWKQTLMIDLSLLNWRNTRDLYN